MRARPAPRSFISGELAPWIDGIANDITLHGARTMENFIVKKQGQAVRRPGTFYLGEVKESSKFTLLIPIQVNDTYSYVVEMGDGYARFWGATTHDYPTVEGPGEVTSPFSTADLSTLSWKYVPNEKRCYFATELGKPLYSIYVRNDGPSRVFEQVPILQSQDVLVANRYGQYAKSDDLRNWTEARVPSDSTGDSLQFMVRGKDNVLVQKTVNIKLSEDAENWVNSLAFTYNLYDAQSSDKGEIVAVGVSATTSGILYISSDDGLSWASRGGPNSGPLYATASDPGRRHWMAVGAATRMYTYEVESAWTSVTETSTLYAVAYGSTNPASDLWVAVGSSVIRSATSVAGAWASVTMTGTLYGVTYGNPAGTDLWVAVGTTSGGAAVIYTSATGTVWTQRYNANTYASAFLDVKWVGGVYLAVGGAIGIAPYGGGPTGTIWATSPDGVTWTVDTTLSKTRAAAWQQIAYREETGITNLTSSANYPRKVGYHEGRLIAVPYGSPARLMASKTNVHNNFYLGETAEGAWEYDLVDDKNVDIQWIVGGADGLVVGTRTAEGVMLGSQDEGITPLTAQFRWLSTFGSSNVRPVRIHDTIVFVQRGGEIIRGFQPVQGAWQSPDLTAYADHIAEGGVTFLEHQDDPQTNLLAIRSDGQLLGMTYENTRAWWRMKAARSTASVAVIESVAVVPTTGAEDEIWLIVNRTIGGSTKRYIEYMDTMAVPSLAGAHYVDCGVDATSGTTFQTVGSMTHLAGELVDVLIDGTRWVSGLTVAASGTITVAPYSGTEIHAGLPYTSYLQTMRGDYGSAYGDGAGMVKRTTNVMAWVHDSSALAKFGPTTALATETIVYSSSTALNTEICNVNFPGQWDRDNYIWCIVSDPKPFTLVAVLADTETGDK
jgi:hypothetical protein